MHSCIHVHPRVLSLPSRRCARRYCCCSFGPALISPALPLSCISFDRGTGWCFFVAPSTHTKEGLVINRRVFQSKHVGRDIHTLPPSSSLLPIIVKPASFIIFIIMIIHWRPRPRRRPHRVQRCRRSRAREGSAPAPPPSAAASWPPPLCVHVGVSVQSI